MPNYQETHEQQVTEYVLAISELLSEAGLHLSPRRTSMLFRSIIAVYATALPLSLELELNDLTYLVLKNSLPMRCVGKEINSLQLLTAHQSAWDLINMPKHSSLRAILESTGPITRLQLALSANDLSRNERSSVVSDVFAGSTMGGRAAIVMYVFEGGFVGELNAPVAEQLGSLYQVMIQPIEFSESVHPGSMRYAIWQEVEDLISKLDTKDRASCQFANYSAHLFTREELTTKLDVHRIHDEWLETMKLLQGGSK